MLPQVDRVPVSWCVIGDSLSYQMGKRFSTKDQDNDVSRFSCAVKCQGAWWYYKDCQQSNLNGRYLRGEHFSFTNGIHWLTWKGFYYSLKATEMKIRPNNAWIFHSQLLITLEFFAVGIGLWNLMALSYYRPSLIFCLVIFLFFFVETDSWYSCIHYTCSAVYSCVHLLNIFNY